MSKYIVHNFLRVATDFVPETFGRLTTLGPKFTKEYGSKGSRKAYLPCKCSCGNPEILILRVDHLKSGSTTSCGCLHREIAVRVNTKHGMERSKEYAAWLKLKDRCYNPNDKAYPVYGGRGIRVCDRWMDPENGSTNFLSDMGLRPSPKHSIDRIDVNGDYCPENCRWATSKQQANNKTNNNRFVAFGKEQTVAEWAEEYGIAYKTLWGRIISGWLGEKALTTPLRITKQRRP